MLATIATVQVVFTVALLAGATLLIRTANKLASVRPGYETERILAVTVTSVTPGQSRQFHTAVLDRVAALPGVARAAFVWGLPLTGNKWPGTMELVGQPGDGTVAGQLSLPLRSITPDYFDVMGMGLVEAAASRRPTPATRQWWRWSTRRSAGSTFRGACWGVRCASRATPTHHPDRRRRRRHQDRGAEHPGGAGGLSVVLAERRVFEAPGRAGGRDPSALSALVRREVHAVDPTASVERFTTMAEIRRTSVAPRTFAMQLLIGFSILATALALVGIYGVLSLSVGSREKEIAVRKAVGAQGRDILRLILGEGSRMIAIGIVLGAVVSIFVGRALENYLFEVWPTDPLSVGIAALVFGLVAFIICLLPATRAGSNDLRNALHQD